MGGFIPNCQAQTFVELAKQEKQMNFQLIHIQRIGNSLASLKEGFTLKKSEYIAIAIEEGGQYYYWAKGISIPISQEEYWRVKTNPKLYYFSTALKLHRRIERVIQTGGSYAI